MLLCIIVHKRDLMNNWFLLSSIQKMFVYLVIYIEYKRKYRKKCSSGIFVYRKIPVSWKKSEVSLKKKKIIEMNLHNYNNLLEISTQVFHHIFINICIILIF